MMVFSIIMIGVLVIAKRRMATPNSRQEQRPFSFGWEQFLLSLRYPWLISLAVFLAIVNVAGTALRRHTMAIRGAPLESIDNALTFNWMRWHLSINEIWPRALEGTSLLFLVIVFI